MTIRVGMFLWSLTREAVTSPRRATVQDYVSGEIIGETAQVWNVRVGKSDRVHKINKRTMKERDGWSRGVPREWMLQGDVNNKVFVDEHRRNIGSAVFGVNDASILKQIANLVGYSTSKVRDGI